MAMFHMSNDSELFRTATQLAETGWRREKENWINGDSCMVPLYEAKMIHQFDHRFGDYGARGDERGFRVMAETPLNSYQDAMFEPEPFYWISRSEVESTLAPRNWKQEWLFGWKEISASTNERTLIASAITKCGVGNKILLMLPMKPEKYAAPILSSFNSLIVDFVIRQKISGLSLSYFIIKQLPILPPAAYSEADLAFIESRVLELSYTSSSMAGFARDLGYSGEAFAWDEDRRAQLRAELDAWYALAYGLTREELRYVLDPKDVMGADYPSETFRVLQNNEVKRYGEYRTQRLVLAAYDELMAQGMRPRLEGYR